MTLQSWAKPTTKRDLRSVKKPTGICLTVPLLFLSRAMFCVKSSVTQLRILRVCLPQEQAPSPEQVVSWYWCLHILWVRPAPGAQEIPDCRAPHQGTRERAPPQDPCQGRGNAATLKCLRTNLIRIPDLNCTCLVSVQQNRFCPHGAVISAETALHYLCFLFYSSGMFQVRFVYLNSLRDGREGEHVKNRQCRQQHSDIVILGCCWQSLGSSSARLSLDWAPALSFCPEVPVAVGKRHCSVPHIPRDRDHFCLSLVQGEKEKSM